MCTSHTDSAEAEQRGLLPAFPTQLERYETSEPTAGVYLTHNRYGPSDSYDQPSASLEEQSFRHADWSNTRRLVYESLCRCHASQRRLDAFAVCGNSLWLCSDGNELTLRCNACRDRACLICQRQRTAGLVEQITARMLDAHRTVRFLTLTLKASPVSLAAKIRRLRECFRTLRRRKEWKTHVVGGAMFFEVKIGANSGQWHVHAHCLIEGSFWSARDIAQAWYEVTGDSFVIDIREIKNPATRAQYVAKYATKAADPSVYKTPDHLDEFLTAIKGVRLYQCFGEWKKFAAEPESHPFDKPTPIGSLHTLASNARAGDPEAQRWIDAALRKWPTLSIFLRGPAP